MYSFTVNGVKHSIDAPPDMPLLWVLRDPLRMTVTKFGCGAGVCGACTVHRGGAAVCSCQIPLRDAEGRALPLSKGSLRPARTPVIRPGSRMMFRNAATARPA